MARLHFKPEHILAVFGRASDATALAGYGWYQEAYQMASYLDALLGQPDDPPVRAAGVIAALSPQVPWPRNQALARLAIANGRASGTLGAMVRQANAIMAGADPLDVLKGPKVRSFYRCIVDPWDTSEVCIDRHAAAIARGGRPLPNDWALDTHGNYGRCQDAYRAAAEAKNVRPSEMQAVTWVQWRIERGISSTTGARTGSRKGTVSHE